MNCAILSTLYVRANGEIPCYDDAGAQITLSHVCADRQFLAEMELDNHNYQHIRQALKAGRPPWTDVCGRCAMLRPAEPFSDLLATKRIRTLQVEPTLACALDCPGCSRLMDLRQRRRPHKLTPPDFDTLLTGLQRASYAIELIEYCGNGEPLNNPQFADFVKTARRCYPHTRQRVVTNGNFCYDQKLASVHIDEFMISCDGARQSSYEQYRRGGYIERVFAFMRAIPAEIAGYRQKKIWKYILFEFNDTDEELLLAQSLMPDLGVDELVFVRTHSQCRSARFDAGGDRLPIVAERVFFDTTPIQQRSHVVYVPKHLIAPCALNGDRGLVMVDELAAETASKLKLRGWLLTDHPVELTIFANNMPVAGKLEKSLARPDVQAQYPRFHGKESGFELTWDSDQMDEVLLTVRVTSGTEGSQEFSYHYAKPPAD